MYVFTAGRTQCIYNIIIQFQVNFPIQAILNMFETISHYFAQRKHNIFKFSIQKDKKKINVSHISLTT